MRARWWNGIRSSRQALRDSSLKIVSSWPTESGRRPHDHRQPSITTHAQIDEMTDLIRRCLDLTLANATARGWQGTSS